MTVPVPSDEVETLKPKNAVPPYHKELVPVEVQPEPADVTTGAASVGVVDDTTLPPAGDEIGIGFGCWSC